MRENGWDTHKNSKSVQGTRKNPRLNPDEDNDLEEDSENEISQSITNQVKVPGKPSRKSPRLNSPDLISRRNIIDDPKLREIHHADSNQELVFINKASNQLEGLKELEESNELNGF